MNKLVMNPNNKKYYSEEYIKGWENGVKAQYEARPKGEWILTELQDEDEIRNGNYLYECSNCKHTDLHAKEQKVPYCWYCGAEMEGGTE